MFTCWSRRGDHSDDHRGLRNTKKMMKGFYQSKVGRPILCNIVTGKNSNGCEEKKIENGTSDVSYSPPQRLVL